ncbi:lipid-binding SYLF domain-containing protein [Mangrovimonas sp. YM274]|uniref:lipid-binding SYLF domain-containing protein n=1 Tax=Mangrovimonas sp. YM274 TaxID=3070660 RepID=UPI0027DDA02C|nr:lipid-binding SYLF domain-containing protein [Mangrovimonas sp. YM274]WMI67438.1 lipid-binding SYLF domain-containing protein [Mangrovimonas sp. YM274]
MKQLKELVFVFVLSMFTISAYSQTEKDRKIIIDAEQAKIEMVEHSPDLKKYFEKSAGYVIFPNVGKGGLIVGGASGNGVLYVSGVAQGMASVKEINIGAQIGGQALIEIIFFETADALDEFKKGDFKFDAGISATALTMGQSLDAKYTDGVAVFTHTKGGLMAEVSVGGQVFHYKPF